MNIKSQKPIIYLTISANPKLQLASTPIIEDNHISKNVKRQMNFVLEQSRNK